MNVPTITEPPEEAQRKLEAYRAQLRRRADAEYEAAAAGYAAMAAGKPLINLTQAINDAGLGEDGRPRLAIARADRPQCQVLWDRRGDSAVFSALKRRTWSYSGDLLIKIPVTWNKEICGGYALVPMIPADVRPNGNLRDFFILWEVDNWSDRPLVAEPPRDPFLLKHMAGDLYSVEAAWDLTELERAIMTGRRES